MTEGKRRRVRQDWKALGYYKRRNGWAVNEGGAVANRDARGDGWAVKGCTDVGIPSRWRTGPPMPLGLPYATALE